ncbi:MULTISPECIES: AAA family ATPase [Bacillus cereus group]|uniref:AAA family ATPase n=1 Tax=Bacillus cereus group TaxID=86661 RepID=UPI000BF3E18D|nr:MULTISPECIES: AAA family ATPase [Bacillus cereus group]PGA25398.1 hypothetical protein COL80_16095 [Bacillus thuringiensis]PGU82182.1 hypothetical protein COD76_11900 [Bacillus cereus]
MKLMICNYIAGAGKSSVADYLEQKHGFKQYALSDGVYKVAEEVFGMDVKNRPLLQDIGELMKQIDPAVWIKETLRRIEKDGHKKVLITDVRFLLEYSYLKYKGFNEFMLYCEPEVAIKRLEERDGEAHEENIMNNMIENQLRPLKDSMKLIDGTQDFEDVKKELDAYVRVLGRK